MAIDLQDLPPTVTVDRAAEILGVSRTCAYDAVTAGQLPAIRIRRRLVVPTSKLLAMLGVDAHAEAEATGDGRAA